MSRKKRVWTCADFAKHAYDDDSPQACRRARRFLKKLDAKHGGQLLTPTTGTNREFTFCPATLSRLEPDLFTAVESLEFRVEALEDTTDAMKLDQRRIVSHVGSISRDVDRLRARRRSAA